MQLKSYCTNRSFEKGTSLLLTVTFHLNMFSLKLNQIQSLQTAIVQTVLQADYLQLHRYLHSYLIADIYKQCINHLF
jgi:hypothetical protein